MAILGAVLFARAKPLWAARWWAALVGSLLMGTTADCAVPKEYQVKAVFLFNFVQFVEWPPSAFATPDDPIVLGVLGPDPFDGALDAAIRNEKVNGRPLVIRRFRRIADLEPCHMLYVSPLLPPEMPQLLEKTKGWSVLTIGESEGFARNGGVIRFINERGHIRLRINVDAARAANLKLSSKLLRPAEIVGHIDN